VLVLVFALLLLRLFKDGPRYSDIDVVSNEMGIEFKKFLVYIQLVLLEQL